MSERYDEMLDEIYGTFKIGVCEFSASLILKELDPIAYETGLFEYEDEEEEDNGNA